MHGKTDNSVKNIFSVFLCLLILLEGRVFNGKQKIYYSNLAVREKKKSNDDDGSCTVIPC
jgi:hypothetical protein